MWYESDLKQAEQIILRITLARRRRRLRLGSRNERAPRGRGLHRGLHTNGRYISQSAKRIKPAECTSDHRARHRWRGNACGSKYRHQIVQWIAAREGLGRSWVIRNRSADATQRGLALDRGCVVEVEEVLRLLACDDLLQCSLPGCFFVSGLHGQLEPTKWASRRMGKHVLEHTLLYRIYTHPPFANERIRWFMIHTRKRTNFAEQFLKYGRWDGRAWKGDRGAVSHYHRLC